MPFVCPLLHFIKIATRSLKLPPRHASELKIDRLKVGVCVTDERLTQVVEAVAQVMWIGSFVVVMNMLHVCDIAVQSCVIPHAKHVHAVQLVEDGDA